MLRSPPLHAAVANAGKLKTIQWSEECSEAFSTAKTALLEATLLVHPNPFSATALTVDASDKAVGAELAQKDKSGLWRPITFFSCWLQAAEQKYSAFDRELLAIYSSIKHFRHFLEGRAFTVFTDHKPLTLSLIHI